MIKNLTETTIRAAFNAHHATLVASYHRMTRRMLADVTKHFPTYGTTERAYSSWHRAAYQYRAIRGMLKTSTDMGYDWEVHGPHHRQWMADKPLELNDARVEKNAQQYADDTVDALTLKVLAKVGELAKAELTFVSGTVNFDLVGFAGSRRVVISQQTIINSSKNGNLFNQYPARIYVDGKFMSAKAYGQQVAEWTKTETVAPKGWDAKIATALDSIDAVSEGWWVITTDDMTDLGWPASAQKHGAYWSAHNPAGKAARAAGFDVSFSKKEGCLSLRAA
jgi:hypothetical protein